MKHGIISNQIGFSLVEIMVSISILSTVFISLMYSYPLGLSLNKNAENATIASYLAQGKLEELHSLGYDNINIGTIESKQRISTDPSNYLYYFQRETITEYVDSNLQTSITDQGLKKLLTTIYYTESSSKQEKSYNITTLISQR